MPLQTLAMPAKELKRHYMHVEPLWIKATHKIGDDSFQTASLEIQNCLYDADSPMLSVLSAFHARTGRAPARK